MLRVFGLFFMFIGALCLALTMGAILAILLDPKAIPVWNNIAIGGFIPFGVLMGGVYLVWKK